MKRRNLRGAASTIIFCALITLLSKPAIAASDVTDTAGDGADAATDLIKLTVEHEPDGIVFRLTTSAAYDFPNTQLLIESDQRPDTGFRDGAHGFDFLIEGAALYQFKGDDQAEWQWGRHCDVARRISGATLQVKIPHERLSTRRFDVVARTLSPQYNEVDRIPNSGVLEVDLTRLALEQAHAQDASEADDPRQDTIDGAGDLLRVAAAQEGHKITFAVKTRAAGGFGTLLVFIDADNKATTGYRSTHSGYGGFDFVINGGRLHQFVGAQQATWAWSAVTDAEITTDGTHWKATFDAGHLESRDVQFIAMMMSSDWQDLLDKTPDRGLLRLKLTGDMNKPQKTTIAPAAPRANRHLPPRARFAQADSFYCYYGSGRVNELSHYDIVIAHSPQMAPADIAALKKLGVVMIGYISVGEDDKLRKGNGQGPGGYASWYFDHDNDGQPDRNNIWNSYYANAADPAWQADRLKAARRLMNEDGYDGIFLDTVDVAASLFPESKPGMIELIRSFRRTAPAAPIVQNQAFGLLAELAPIVDGLMIESFTATYDFENREYILHSPSSLDWTRGIAQNTIDPVRQTTDLQVLVLDYARPDQRESIQMAADRAATFGYRFAAAPIHLDDVYHTGIIGKPDPKWRLRLATPEVMKHVLPAAKNGFPAGTVLMPSGCYGGYRVDPIVDGVRDREKLHWTNAAWASADDGDVAWLEIRFPQPQSRRTLRVRWATDNGRLHASRDYRVEVQRSGKWHIVQHVTGNTAEVTIHTLPADPFDAVRLYQPPGGGNKLRPNLMWIAQVEWE